MPVDRRTLLYHFTRMQLPRVAISLSRFNEHLERGFAIFAEKSPGVDWTRYLDGLYAVDWLVCAGCLDNLSAAWETLFAARAGRSDSLLVDALRARAARLYPRNEERQESAVVEFWSQLIVSDNDTRPVLARYDGQRPLAPWLIRVFQNAHVSRLRQNHKPSALPEDDLAAPLPALSPADARWHDLFVQAAREWLDTLSDSERLLLGLRWRYRLSQRDVAAQLGVHEGTVSRQNDKLRDRALEMIGQRMQDCGWIGDDLEGLILNELGGVLTDDPRLSAVRLAKTLQQPDAATAINAK